MGTSQSLIGVWSLKKNAREDFYMCQINLWIIFLRWHLNCLPRQFLLFYKPFISGKTVCTNDDCSKWLSLKDKSVCHVFCTFHLWWGPGFKAFGYKSSPEEIHHYPTKPRQKPRLGTPTEKHLLMKIHDYKVYIDIYQEHTNIMDRVESITLKYT